MAEKDAEILDLVKSWDSYQARLTSLTTEMEQMNGTTQRLMGVNVELKSEMEKMKKVAEEVAAKPQKRIDKSSPVIFIPASLIKSIFPTTFGHKQRLTWFSSGKMMKRSSVNAKSTGRRKAVMRSRLLLTKTFPKIRFFLMFYLGGTCLRCSQIVCFVLGDRRWWWSPFFFQYGVAPLCSLINKNTFGYLILRKILCFKHVYR